jgi:hypothetical protein
MEPARPPYGPRKTSRKAALKELAQTQSHPRVALAGWVLFAIGVVCLLIWPWSQWRAGSGDGFLAYRPRVAPTGHVGGWPPVFVLLAPLVAINLVFFGTDRRHRRSAFTVVVTMLVLELAFAFATAMWAAGALMPPGLLLDPSGGGDVYFPLVFVFGICLFAGAMMGWAPDDSDQGFEERPWPLGSRVAWLGGAVALWLALLVPAWLAAHHAHHWGGSDASRPWPAPWPEAARLRALTIVGYVFTSIPVGVFLSAVVKGLPSPVRTVPSRTGVLKWAQYAPMVAAALLVSTALGSVLPSGRNGPVLALLLVSLVLFSVGVVLLRGPRRGRGRSR